MSSSTAFKVAQDKLRAALAATPVIMVAVLAVGMHATDVRAGETEPAKQDVTIKKDIAAAANAYESMRQRMYGGVSSIIYGDSSRPYGQVANSATAGRVQSGAVDYSRPYSPGSR